MSWGNSISDELGGVWSQKTTSLAQRTGLIKGMGAHALNVACRQCRECRDQGARVLRVAVNDSLRQLYGANLVTLLVQCPENYDLPSDALDLEITEGSLPDDTPEVSQTLNAISELGVPLSIDDFGTGYSSLSVLRRFPIDVLKIDRSFVAGLPEKRDATILVDTMISMAHSLGFKLVAEGVETAAQHNYLTQRKCDYLQG